MAAPSGRHFGREGVTAPTFRFTSVKPPDLAAQDRYQPAVTVRKTSPPGDRRYSGLTGSNRPPLMLKQRVQGSLECDSKHPQVSEKFAAGQTPSHL